MVAYVLKSESSRKTSYPATLAVLPSRMTSPISLLDSAFLTRIPTPPHPLAPGFVSHSAVLPCLVVDRLAFSDLDSKGEGAGHYPLPKCLKGVRSIPARVLAPIG
jgi:hypothetical protein